MLVGFLLAAPLVFSTGSQYLDSVQERSASHNAVVASAVNAGSNYDAANDGQQSFFGDLAVESGQTLDGNVIVYSGDVSIQEAGRITGDLVVYSGDVEIREGARADGNVTAFSGDVMVAGEVGGNLAATSGDVTLRGTARVQGNVSILNGDLDRQEGAFVGGNVVTGPSIPVPEIPSLPLPMPGFPDAAKNAISEPAQSVLGSIGRFVARSVGAGLIAVLTGLVIAVIAVIRQGFVERTRRVAQDEPALSFVAGILANLITLALAGILAVTICLAPMSAVMLVILAGLNLAGWAGMSAALAQRASVAERLSIKPEYALGIIAVAVAGGLGLLWAMGGCFRFLGMAASLVVSSVGAGAVLLPLLRRSGSDTASPANHGELP